MEELKSQLVSLLQEKTGLDASKSSGAIDAILDFLKENPEKLTSLLGDDPTGTVTDTLGKLFGR